METEIHSETIIKPSLSGVAKDALQGADGDGQDIMS